MRSLAFKETALGLRSGSLASNGRNLTASLFPEHVGVKENRKILLCKTSGGGMEICEIKNKNAARGSGGLHSRPLDPNSAGDRSRILTSRASHSAGRPGLGNRRGSWPEA